MPSQEYQNFQAKQKAKYPLYSEFLRLLQCTLLACARPTTLPLTSAASSLSAPTLSAPTAADSSPSTAPGSSWSTRCSTSKTFVQSTGKGFSILSKLKDRFTATTRRLANNAKEYQFKFKSLFQLCNPSNEELGAVYTRTILCTILCTICIQMAGSKSLSHSNCKRAHERKHKVSQK
jgi:hypothetical protein